MGRMKGKHLHTAAKKLVKVYLNDFSSDFDVNKKKLKELDIMSSSKEEQNKIAGELVNIMKRVERDAKKEEERQ